jgi:ligand-binding sensor domain-containing protein
LEIHFLPIVPGSKNEKMKFKLIFTSLFVFILSTACIGQNQTDSSNVNGNSDSDSIITSYGPNSITRNIIQDKNGKIWIASFNGIFRYDGKAFTNITRLVTSTRFFSLLEDKKGNFWFGSIGSGFYYYDGKTFRNFTTKDGLLNNEIVCIYEDKIGNIWFGANGGASRYDGKSFQNFMISEDSIVEDKTGKTFPDLTRPPKEVNSIIEDKTGKFWFATRGKAFVYDGKKFTIITHEGKPFTNVRTLMEDKKGNIWLAGSNGLWRYDGKTFKNFTTNFVGYVYEDRNGNIWTSSETSRGWVLSWYDVKSLSYMIPIVTEINSAYNEHKGMLFGIMEANDGNIWFGSFGVYRYDGSRITDFKN